MSNTNNNPFADLFGNFSKNTQFPSAIDWDSIVSAGRLNAKALSDAAKATSEGLQAIANRQAEIAKKATEDASKFFSDISATKSPEAGLAKQAEVAKKAFESAIANSNELAGMAAKSSEEANKIVNKRVCEALDEIANNAKQKKEKPNAA